MNIQPATPSGGDVGLDAHRFHGEPERSPRIPRPPTIPFRIVSKVAITSSGIELRQSHRVASQIEERLQRPPRDHLLRFVQLEPDDLKAHGALRLIRVLAVSRPIITLC